MNEDTAKALAGARRLTSSQAKAFVQHIVEISEKGLFKTVCRKCEHSIGACMCPERWKPWQEAIRAKLRQTAPADTMDMVMELVAELDWRRRADEELRRQWQTRCPPLADATDAGGCGCGEMDARRCLLSSIQPGMDGERGLYELHEALPFGYKIGIEIDGRTGSAKWAEAVKHYIDVLKVMAEGDRETIKTLQARLDELEDRSPK